MLHPNFIFAFTVTMVVLGAMAAASLIGLSVYQLYHLWRAVRERITREIGLGLLVWLILSLLPLTVFGAVVSPVETVVGIAMAGAVVGLALAPVFIWKTRGPFLRKIAAGALTVVGSSYLALFVIAFLIAGASD